MRRQKKRTGTGPATPICRGTDGQQVLTNPRAGRVRKVVSDAQRADPRGNLGVPITWQVGEQVVLDLVAEVSAHERHHRSGVEVSVPSICLRYHAAFVSSSSTASVNFSAPSVK